MGMISVRASSREHPSQRQPATDAPPWEENGWEENDWEENDWRSPRRQPHPSTLYTIRTFGPWGMTATRSAPGTGSPHTGPLGSVMRVRLKAYKAIAAFRRTKIGAPSTEPSAFRSLPD